MTRLRLLAATVLTALAAVAVALAVDGGDAVAAKGSMTVKLATAKGKSAGTVKLTQRGGRLAVAVRARGLSKGFHGFHFHETGECKAPSSDGMERGAFLSAGGHHAKGDQEHGEHAGDMPSLVAGADGRAAASFTMPGSLAELRKGDGSAVMIHLERDNFANIPGRYDPAPDEETRTTGDAGDRFACGVL